ncbi:glutamyl-tRNA reductase [Halocatena halophila]|uniref:glutamyl-tRNA reductase n=1 Tax=Halocatena halophila TaxID=2814576 RepID=UPI002ED3E633
MTAGSGVITGWSVAHSHADIETIEAACARPPAAIVDALLDSPSVSEAFCLQTCNRAEWYVVTESADTGSTALETATPAVPADARHRLDHETALEHLLRVACGLESLVLGEDQILGQVRDAYATATERGGIGPVLEAAITKAIHVGERARTETTINEGVVSLGSAAVELAARRIDLSSATATVVGAGEMGAIAANALSTAAERVVVANRTVDRATHIATAIDNGTAIGLDSLGVALESTDLVVSATASDEQIIDRSLLESRDIGRTTFIDIAQPRDIDPTLTECAGITVYDLDALEEITRATTANREQAALAVESMIDTAVDRLLIQYKRKQADEVIAAMYEGAERMKERELSTALSKLRADGELTAEQRATVESLADSLINQLLAAPTKSLRDAAERDDWSTINTALQLFDPGDTERSVRTGATAVHPESADDD